MSFNSKTELTCDCGALDRAAKDPELPIEFDARLNEFHLVYGRGRRLLDHCWSCGGKAPESLRGTLFARISRQEQDRLLALVPDVTTVSELIARLGPPDSDSSQGVVLESPEQDGKAPTAEARRLLVHANLSEVAYLSAEVNADDRVAISLQGKYIGPRDGAATQPGG
jgi:hypothetical protein